MTNWHEHNGKEAESGQPAASKKRVRYQIKDKPRFFGFLGVLVVIVIAIIAILPKQPDAKTPSATPPPVTSSTPTVTPTPALSTVTVPDGYREAPLLVVLDPGHGGRDPGAVAPYDENIHESDIVLDVASKVAALLETEGVPVLMTRTEDEHLADTVSEDLRLRAEVANQADATLFVSIHVNSYDLKQTGGAQVNGLELYYYGSNSSCYESFNSALFADTMIDSVASQNSMPHGDSIQRSLAVLRQTSMPAVLVELGYITNQSDAARLADQAFRMSTARGITDGIEAVLETIGVVESNGTSVVWKREEGH